MAIRYNEDLNKQILKTVRNFNAKVAKLERQGVELPVEKVSVRELKKEFTSRRELMSYLRELRKFSQRGVERIAYVDRWGKKYTMYEFKVGGIRQRRAIREAERLLEEAQRSHRTEGGVPGPQTLMGTDYAENLKANLQKLKTERYHQRRMSSAKKAQMLRASTKVLGSKKYQFAIKDNFFHHLYVLGSAAGLDRSYLAEIENVLRNVPAQDFERMRSAEELINAIEEYYPQWKDAKTPTEKAAIGQAVRPLIVALHDNVTTIVRQYTEDIDIEE